MGSCALRPNIMLESTWETAGTQDHANKHADQARGAWPAKVHGS